MTCQQFGSRERVRVYWDSLETSAVAAFTAGTVGTGQITVKVPLVAGGTHALLVRGATHGKVVTLSIRVKPAVTLSPTSGAAGTRVRVTFTGYKAGEVITLRWYVNSTTSVVVTTEITANGAGTTAYT